MPLPEMFEERPRRERMSRSMKLLREAPMESICSYAAWLFFDRIRPQTALQPLL